MHKAFAITLSALLAGCNMAPPHDRPALPTAADYPAGFANDVTLGKRATEIGWRNFSLIHSLKRW